MPRLFLGNFDFEHQLADPGHQPSAMLKRINAELATSWLAVADDGDYLWCPEAIEPSFFEEAAQHGLPRVIPIDDLRKVPSGSELIPWGWTDQLRRLAPLQNGLSAPPDGSVIRTANSREFSFELEVETQSGPPEMSSISSPDQLDGAVQRTMCISERVVIKANWGMSGRERIMISGPPTRAARAWVRQRLASQGVVFVEPWVQRLEEIGVQLDVPQQGSPLLLGVTSLHCDRLGQYRGSWFTDPPDAGEDFHHRWQPAVDFALRAAERLQRLGYFGPLGIDAMRYRLPDGSVRLRLFQDINARWTMGRLAFGWRRLFPDRRYGFWWHGPAAETPAWPAGSIREFDVIRTSPQRIGNAPAAHASYLLLSPP